MAVEISQRTSPLSPSAESPLVMRSPLSATDAPSASPAELISGSTSLLTAGQSLAVPLASVAHGHPSTGGAPSAESARGPLSGAPVQRMIARGAHGRGTAPVTATEISPAATSGRPTLLWRKSLRDGNVRGGATQASGNGNSYTLPSPSSPISSSPPRVARFLETPGPEAGNATGENADMPAAPSLNVAALAEQVSRILQRQLTIERERRGTGLW
jgi:hypothetical protein